MGNCVVRAIQLQDNCKMNLPRHAVNVTMMQKRLNRLEAVISGDLDKNQEKASSKYKKKKKEQGVPKCNQVPICVLFCNRVSRQRSFDFM